MSNNTHVLELLPAYVLGSLDQDEHRLVVEHLAVCPACAAELPAYQALVDQLALAAPEVRPPADLKRRLMARLSGPASAQPGQPGQLPWWQQWPKFVRQTALMWGIASFILILVLAASNLLLWQRVTQLEAVTRSGGMRAIPLSSTGLVPGAAGFVIIGADGRNGAFVVDALPPLNADQKYQLWLVQNGQRTSGALFSVDENGYGGGRILAPKNLFEYSGCDVSIEPALGSPAPTGEKVLGGALK